MVLVLLLTAVVVAAAAPPALKPGAEMPELRADSLRSDRQPFFPHDYFSLPFPRGPPPAGNGLSPLSLFSRQRLERLPTLLSWPLPAGSAAPPSSPGTAVINHPYGCTEQSRTYQAPIAGAQARAFARLVRAGYRVNLVLDDLPALSPRDGSELRVQRPGDAAGAGSLPVLDLDAGGTIYRYGHAIGAQLVAETPADADADDERAPASPTLLHNHLHLVIGLGQDDVPVALFSQSSSRRSCLDPRPQYLVPAPGGNGTIAVEWTVRAEVARLVSARAGTEMLRWSRRWYLYARLLDQDDDSTRWLLLVGGLLVVILGVSLLGCLLRRRVRISYQLLVDDDPAERGGVGGEDDSWAPRRLDWKHLRRYAFQIPRNVALLCALLATGLHLWAMLTVLLLLAMLISGPWTTGRLCRILLVLYPATGALPGAALVFLQRSWSMVPGNRALGFLLLIYPVWLGPLCGLLVATSFRWLGWVSLLFALLVCSGLWAVFCASAWIGHRVALWQGCGCSALLARSSAAHPPQQHPQPDRSGLCVPSGTGRAVALLAMLMVSGAVSFVTIAWPVYYAISAIWGHRLFLWFGVMALLCLVSLLQSGVMSATAVFSLLSGGNASWWWPAFFVGGAAAPFVLFFALVYVLVDAHISDPLTLLFFAAASSLLGWAVFLLLGSAGLVGAYTFVLLLYRGIRSD